MDLIPRTVPCSQFRIISHFPIVELDGTKGDDARAANENDDEPGPRKKKDLWKYPECHALH